MSGTQRLVVGAVALTAAALVGAGLWLARPPEGPPPLEPVAAAPVPEPASEPASESALVAAPEPPAVAAPAPLSDEARALGGDVEPEVAEALLQEETVRDRLYRLALEEEARQRFDDSLEQSGITAAEIEGGVKRLFETVRVEPVLGRAGRMDGMMIRGLHEGHPFHHAGFREGDRLTRFDDWPLDDAGTLPEVLIRLRRTFVACAVPEGTADGERCAEVTVDAPR